MLKGIFFLIVGFFVTACGSPVITKQSGINETQSIYLVADNLVGYQVSVGHIKDHRITSGDLTDDPLSIVTSADSKLQNSDVLEINVSKGDNFIKVKNKTGKVIYSKNMYFSAGQKSTINLKD